MTTTGSRASPGMATLSARVAARGRPLWRCFSLALAGTLLAESGLALPLPQGDLERQCWQQYTRARTRPGKDPTSVEFSNLRDGDTVRSPLLVSFAVRGMGVVPAGKPLAGAGHHHLLIDRPLPRNVGDEIPFSDTHKHFGKGQTFTQIDLPPGPHRLRRGKAARRVNARQTRRLCPVHPPT